jgi:hypothetical protein
VSSSALGPSGLDARAGPDDETSVELRALIDAPSVRVAAAFDLLLWISVIFVMVAKPFE